ncbi:hypothetical protein [Methanobacterium sp.]|uniref:hypothetical protein n=1 Tax=Methanobacterium sp. TaxID=2164 RepID=UPI003C76ADE5
MKQNNLIVVIVLVAVIVIGALAATTFMKPQGQQASAAGEQSTKLAFYNNGTTWVSADFNLENVTLKNGSIQTIYSEEYIKPGDKVTIDLSELAGYSNEPLPAGTTITFLAWFGLNNANNSTGNLNITMQGWSNTFDPQTGDQGLNLGYTGLPDDGSINLTDSAVFTDTDMNSLIQKVGFDDSTNSQEPLFVQGTITVNSDGTVTITTLNTPTLCSLMANSV